MKGIILCGGHGTRLYPLTSFISKPLLPVCGKPVLNFILDKIDKIPEISEIFINTNKKFHKQYEEWLKYNKNDYKKKISLENISPVFGKKLIWGIDAIDKIIKKNKVKEDVLVVAGDNVFSYSLKNSMKFFKKKKSTVILLSKVKTKEKAKKFGVISLDENNKIIDFSEKPKHPKSTLISTAIYFFSRGDLKNVGDYNKSKHRGESIGNFLKYLYKKKDVYGFLPKGEFLDIGTIDDYKKANKVCWSW